MKNLKLNIIALALLALASCNKDKLTPVPQTLISEDQAFSTKARIEGQVRAIYSAIKSAGLYGGRYQIFNDIRGGDWNNERTNVVTGYDVWQYTPNNSSTNSVQNHWSQAYYAINLANVFIDGMDTKGGNAIAGTSAKPWIAEAKFLRAATYYTLLQLYARPFADGNGSKLGVPLRLTPNTGSGNYDKARNTVAECYTQIIKDLNEAEVDLPATQGTAVLNTTRAHKNTAIAFKVRVYLSMGGTTNYTSAVGEANKIVPATAPFNATSGVAHSLNASYVNVFRTPYTATESILSMPFAANEAPGTQNQLGYYYGPAALNGGNGEYSLIPTGIIADAGWKASDARRSLIIVSGGKSWSSKYNGASPFIDYAPVMRWAEVLLSLAEAKVRVSGTVDAQSLALLNAVRQRSDATTTFLPTDFATANDFLNAVLKERRIEFLAEGLAGPDLTRLLQPLPAKPGVAAVPSTSQQYIWPISSTELLLNRLCVDN